MNDNDIIGTVLVFISTCVSIIGVVCNNVFLDHVAAMQVWMISNILFAIFFYGQFKKYWNGGLPSIILFWFYVLCTVTGMYGLWFT